MKKLLLNIALLSLINLFFAACKSSSEQKNSSQSSSEEMAVNNKGLSKSKIIIKTVHGNITFSLYPQKAPNTVKRIVELTKKGFYDGIVFHRVVPNFVVQGGDPTGTGTGGSGKKLKAEFNDIPHIRGTVAMARSMNIDSADSQFYIAMKTLPHLDGKYTVFGQVIEGLDLIDKINQGDKIISMSFVP